MVDAAIEAAPRTCVVPYGSFYERQVLALAREMHAESVAHRGIPLDEAKVVQQLNASHSMPDTIYFRIAVRGEEVLGGFFGIISTLYFSQDRVARDMAWFVRRDRRGSRAAVLLVADFERWAEERGVRDFMLGQPPAVKNETTRALYEHLGYEVVGFNTVKRKR